MKPGSDFALILFRKTIFTLMYHIMKLIHWPFVTLLLTGFKKTKVNTYLAD